MTKEDSENITTLDYILKIIKEVRQSFLVEQEQKEKIEFMLHNVYWITQRSQMHARNNVAMIRALQKKVEYLENNNYKQIKENDK